MDSVMEVIKQDVSVALKAFEKDNFGLVNTMGNRIMSNLLIGGRNDLMIIGYLLRDVSGEFEIIKRRREEKLKECKKIGKAFIIDINSMINDEKIDFKKILDRYYEYENKIRKYTLTELELSVYKGNLDFTKRTTSALVQYLKENKEILLKENNQLISGIINEQSRVINEHGAEPPDLVLYLLMKALEGYYKYILYGETVRGVIEDKEEFKNKIYPYVDKIVGLLSNSNSEDLYVHSNEILGELGSEWRKLFINYMEIREVAYIEERRPPVEIPEEAKRRIGETIAGAFENETKKK